MVDRVSFSPGSPTSLGYRMPAEFDRHAATWLSWPHKDASWPGKLDRVPPLWVEMVRALVPGEIVNILVNDAAPAPVVRELLRHAEIPLERVRLHAVATDDAWIRDSGPTFVTRQSRAGAGTGLAIIDWGYNAWGGKYPPWENDDAIPRQVAEILGGLPVFTPGMVLEGGSIDVNGHGTLLTTESCLLNPNRNPRLSRSDIERQLRDHLGVHNILWLGDGIAGDDTDGHVDDLTRFVDAQTVVTVLESDPHDINYQPLQDNLSRLQAMRDQDGRALRIVTLPMPPPLEYEGQRLPASYANFYIGNAAVLLPTFDQPSDATATAALAPLFPGRRIVPIPATDFVWGLGACHCATQQQPYS